MSTRHILAHRNETGLDFEQRMVCNAVDSQIMIGREKYIIVLLKISLGGQNLNSTASNSTTVTLRGQN